MTNALRLAYERGVKIAFGTDAGVNDHGTNAYEMVLMNEAGMPERAILISATINAADLMDRGGKRCGHCCYRWQSS
jgi:imidazolonepropionase-like amidohydrolase